MKCQNDLLKDTVFSVEKYSKWLQQNIKLWNRKQFSDLDYIQDDIELTDRQMLGITITVLMLNLIGFITLIVMTFKENN